MKKYLFRILVGLLAFGVEVGFVICNLTLMEFFPAVLAKNEQTETLVTPYSTYPKSKIEIHFIGYGRFSNRPTLKFKVINNSSNPMKYRASEAEKLEIFVKFNGEKIDRLAGSVCALREEDEFVLQPNATFQTEFVADLLTINHLNKKGKFEFGFSYYTFENYSWKTWTQPITISEKIKKDINRGFAKLLKRNG